MNEKGLIQGSPVMNNNAEGKKPRCVRFGNYDGTNINCTTFCWHKNDCIEEGSISVINIDNGDISWKNELKIV